MPKVNSHSNTIKRRDLWHSTAYSPSKDEILYSFAFPGHEGSVYNDVNDTVETIKTNIDFNLLLDRARDHIYAGQSLSAGSLKIHLSPDLYHLFFVKEGIG